MAKSDNYTELLQDNGDSDDVEILEVVGVEGEAISSPPPRAAPTEEEEGPEEYLLDFDDPISPAATGEVAEGAGGDQAETDQEQLLRVRADYDNLRKRISRERREFERHANGALVSRLLPVLDNLERALAADASAGGEAVLREGLIIIYRQLTEQLRQEGLEPIEAVGQPFDPNLHDAVETDATSAEPANTIVVELQRGYLFKDRVLRPSSVRVSTGEAGLVEDA
jgi:molecular chaperone GrpE